MESRALAGSLLIEGWNYMAEQLGRTAQYLAASPHEGGFASLLAVEAAAAVAPNGFTLRVTAPPAGLVPGILNTPETATRQHDAPKDAAMQSRLARDPFGGDRDAHIALRTERGEAWRQSHTPLEAVVTTAALREVGAAQKLKIKELVAARAVKLTVVEEAMRAQVTSDGMTLFYGDKGRIGYREHIDRSGGTMIVGEAALRAMEEDMEVLRSGQLCEEEVLELFE